MWRSCLPGLAYHLPLTMGQYVPWSSSDLITRVSLRSDICVSREMRTLLSVASLDSGEHHEQKTGPPTNCSKSTLNSCKLHPLKLFIWRKLLTVGVLAGMEKLRIHDMIHVRNTFEWQNMAKLRQGGLFDDDWITDLRWSACLKFSNNDKQTHVREIDWEDLDVPHRSHSFKSVAEKHICSTKFEWWAGVSLARVPGGKQGMSRFASPADMV